jgi:hypothetical protein
MQLKIAGDFFNEEMNNPAVIASRNPFLSSPGEMTTKMSSALTLRISKKILSQS